MSDIGVHSNVYQRVREYGQLIDEVLVNLRSKVKNPSDQSQKKLAQLLSGLEATSTPSLQTAWLGMIIGDSNPTSRSELARIGRELLSETVNPQVIDKLENLARILEDQRADTLIKMRGMRT